MITKKAKGPRAIRVQFYRPEVLNNRRPREWRWRMRTMNGHIVGASTEGYRNRLHCGRNFELVTGFTDERAAEWVVWR